MTGLSRQGIDARKASGRAFVKRARGVRMDVVTKSSLNWCEAKWDSKGTKSLWLPEATYLPPLLNPAAAFTKFSAQWGAPSAWMWVYAAKVFL